MKNKLTGVTPKPTYPCCNCCRVPDWDALGYTCVLPGCGRSAQDRHPDPCILCGQRTVLRP